MKVGVCGITGSQGGAVAENLLNEYQVVGITRNPESDRGKYFKNKGVIIRKADFDDIHSIKNAFYDCEVIYLMTNFWEHMSPKKEFKQATEIINSLRNTQVKHIIWSTFEDTRDYNDNIKYLGDEYKVPHFDEKGKVSKYLQNQDINSTHLYTSFFNENLTGMMKLKKDNDGVRRLVIPMGNKPLPIVALNDIGQMVKKIIKQKIYGDVGVASNHITIKEMVTILTDVIGEPVEYVNVDHETYRNFGFPGCKDLGNMFEFKFVHNQQFCEKRNMERVKELIDPIDFKKWCKQNVNNLI